MQMEYISVSYVRAKMGFKRNGNVIATKDKHSDHRAVRRHCISSLPRIAEGRPWRKYLAVFVFHCYRKR